ncbi:MAG TPA: cytochrome c peroxidase [Dissulfurispiraceae bacterium]|nr:cytochrome c peroxidase [Dissulfurispiraceae bacterium]
MNTGMLRSAIGVSAAVILTAALVGIAFGADADKELLQRAGGIFKALPKAMESDQNPITPSKVKLGKMLFYESRISIDGTVNCAKCHPMSLYAADGLRKSIGNNCKVNPRNAPSLLNAADQISEHWIGNRTSVEDQAKQSVIGPPAFGMVKYEDVEKRLKEYAEYVSMFKEAFPADKQPVTVDNFAKAIGAFERTLVTPSPFDSYLSGDTGVLTVKQKSGLKTFMEMGCMGCHSGAYIGGQMYQKFGIVEPYWKYTKSEKIDEGRYAVTKVEADKYVFKVPILRNVEKTPPYFHDGSVDRLEDAVMIMGKVQLGRTLTQEQAASIADFLKSLTGKIPEDALTIPILPSIE